MKVLFNFENGTIASYRNANTKAKANRTVTNEDKTESTIEMNSSETEPIQNLIPPISIVPARLHTFYHDKTRLPPIMKKNVDLLSRSHPTFDCNIFDLNSGHSFIQQNFDYEVLTAFEQLNPYAFKSDLLRYCILYIQGGVYIDIKYVCQEGFHFEQLLDKEYFVSEPVGIQNCLIVVQPRNELMRLLIASIVTHVQTKDYCKGATAISGPLLISRLYKNRYTKSNIKLHDDLTWTWKGAWPGIHVIMRKNSEILRQYPEYRAELSKYAGQAHYTTLYDQRKVYGEKMVHEINGNADQTIDKKRKLDTSFSDDLNSTKT